MTEITENDYISEKTAVALGIFDGLHHGHRAVLSETLNREKASAVFTFRTESIKRKHGRPFEYIFTNSYKLEQLSGMGIRYVYSPDFDNVKSMSGEEFVTNILIKKLNAGLVVCGENFSFGRNASCGAEELVKFGRIYGFDVKIIELDGFSSEKYRKMLREGKVEELCENNDDYILSAEVVTGNKIGRTIGFPTINQNFAENQLVPRFGVYYTSVIIGGKSYTAVTNVGVKPTVEDNIKPLAETHILDFSGDLYGSFVDLAFRRFIRDEIKFASVKELKDQINADTEYVRRLHENIGKD